MLRCDLRNLIFSRGASPQRRALVKLCAGRCLGPMSRPCCGGTSAEVRPAWGVA